MTDIVSPPTIDALPTPPQPTDTPEDFDTKAYASLQAQATMVTQANAANAATFQNATAANERAIAAAEQANLATSNGAAQVLLAAEQVGIAAAQASIATDAANAARAVSNFVGDWSSLTGPLAKPATTYHNGLFWVLLNDLPDVAASEPGVSADWVESSVMPVYAYADRGELRSAGGQLALVEGLGLFRYVAGSTEPDDDESCFATAGGRWLLQAVHWDVLDQWHLPESSARDELIERLAAAWPGRMLKGTGVCGITSVATVASTAFAVTVAGAAVGDRAIAMAPGALGATDADSARLSYHAYVSATDTVTVRLCNASAATATTSATARGTWSVIVIKEV